MNLNSEIKVRSVKDGWNEYDSIAVIDQDVRMENMSGWEEESPTLVIHLQLGSKELTSAGHAEFGGLPFLRLDNATAETVQ
jgi:hypothetical protein